MPLPRDELYGGVNAQEYESRRVGTKTWRREDEIVGSFLKKVSRKEEMTVLDVPVGTGRFFSLYEALGCRVIGFDISEDMISQAHKRQHANTFLGVADVRELPLPPRVANVAVSIRLLHLVDGRTRDAAIAELRRVVKTDGYIILGARTHEWEVDSPVRGQIGNLLRIASRTLKFRTGFANSRSHSKRRLMRALDRNAMTIDSSELATRYPDGSYYAIFLLRPATGTGRRGKRITIELFGLPGSGKTTLVRGALQAPKIELFDGYASMEKLSAWQCIRRRPLSAVRLFIRLLPCGREIILPPAKKVIVTALRQRVAALSAGSSTCVFEEGTCHEAWRQLVRGHHLSQRLLGAVLPAADVTIFVDAPPEIVKQRLNTKPYPGPINRALIAVDLDSQLWKRALVASRTIQQTIVARRAGSFLTLTNDSEPDVGRATLEDMILDLMPGVHVPPNAGTR